MKIDDVSVEIRDASLTRVGVLSEQDLTGLTIVRQQKDVGTWTLELPILVDGAQHQAVPLLTADGAGIIVTTPEWTFSGPAGPDGVSIISDPDSDLGTYLSISGVSDAVVLSNMLAWPSPSADLSTQVESLLRTGNREDLLVEVLSNVSRAGVLVPTSQSRGTDAQITMDWQTVLEAAASLAYSTFAFDVVQEGADLQTVIREVADLSTKVGFSTETGALSNLTVVASPPTVTRAIVKETDDDGNVSFTEVTTSAGLEAEDVWGRRETITTPSEDETATQAGESAISDGLSDLVSASGAIADDALLDGVQPGDIVAVRDELDTWRTAQITSITTAFTDGVIQSATLGDFTSTQAKQLFRQRSQERRLRRIERKL
jgi:hypothetical protein